MHKSNKYKLDKNKYQLYLTETNSDTASDQPLEKWEILQESHRKRSTACCVGLCDEQILENRINDKEISSLNVDQQILPRSVRT